MISKRFILVISFFFIIWHVLAQVNINKDEQELLDVINAARTKPQEFLVRYKTELSSNPRFIERLRKSNPMNPLVFHEGLYDAAKERITGNLNPHYEGNFCNESIAYESGIGLVKKNIDVVKENSINVLNPDYNFIGIAYQIVNKSYKLSIFWGQDCKSKIEKKKFVFIGEIDSSSVNFRKINTAKNAGYMHEREKQMVREINFARCYPRIYANIIRKEMNEYSDMWGGIKHDKQIALKELLTELDSAKGLSKPLYPRECIYKAAKTHAKDQTRRGFIDHEGSDGSQPWVRIKRKCPDMKQGNENLVGGNKSVRFSVIVLLIDDGIPGRGHRYNMLDPNWTHVGCYYNGTVGKMPYCWIQNFASFK